MKKELKGNLILLLTAMVWGMGFVAQKASVSLGPFTYNGIRFLLAGMVLIPVIFALQKKSKIDTKVKRSELWKNSIKAGIICGFVLCLGANLQQFGIYFETDASKAGFITSLYIVIVPILCLLLKRRVQPIAWVCVFIGIVGFYFLTMAGKGQGLFLQAGDFFVLLCAFVFALHIIVVDSFIVKCDGVIIASVQFFVAGVLSIILMAIFESPDAKEIISLWLPIVYGGVISGGVGYTLQIVGQQYAKPTTGSMIMSLEAVFSVIFGVLLLGESMTLLEVMGCAIIFVAVMLPQLMENMGVNK